MEDKKKSSKGLVVIIVILTVLLLGAVGYICCDKGVFDKFIGKEDPKQQEKIKEEKLSEKDVMKLHDSLISDGRGASLFFYNDVTIDNVTATQIMPYVLLNYIKDNNIQNLPTTLENSIPVPKNLVDNYTSKLFNTDRIFTLPYEEGKQSSVYIYWPDRSTISKYDQDNYYLSNSGYDAGFEQFYSRFSKFEQENDNVYVYYKAFYYTVDIGGCSVKSGKVSSSDENVVLSVNYREKNVYNNDDTKWYNERADINNRVNVNYVFDNYLNKLSTYKSTFKKGTDGKYYWYSSEIVNE